MGLVRGALGTASSTRWVRPGTESWPPWEEFNVDGVRDRSHPVEEELDGAWPGVAVLGDSVTMGAGLEPQGSLPPHWLESP